MQKNRFFVFTLPIFCLLFACSREDKGEKQFAAMNAIQTLKSPEDCNKVSHFICNQGLSFVKLGDSLAGLTFTDATIKSVKDTVISTEDYNAFGKIIKLSEGTISIESMPFEKGESDNDLTHAHVGAIRIQSALFSTSENIKIGSTFEQLKSIYPDSLMVIEPGEAAGEIEIKVPKITRINYTLQQKNNAEAKPGAEMYEVSDIAKDAKVAAITIIQ